MVNLYGELTPESGFRTGLASKKREKKEAPLMDINAPASELKNIGPHRLALLRRMGIRDVLDIIEHFPKDYEDRTKIVEPSEAASGEFNAVKARVAKPAENAPSNGKIVTSLALSGEDGALSAIWINQPYLSRQFRRGETYIFGGRVEEFFGKKTMRAPDFEKCSSKPLLSFGRITPVYPVTAGISQKMMRGFIKTALDGVRGGIVDRVPERTRLKYGLCEKESAVFGVHFPKSAREFSEARARLAFEEMFVTMCALIKMKGELRSVSRFTCEKTDVSPFERRLGFSFTAAQRRALDEIEADMRSGYVMNRLVQGDVGSGKTAIMAAAAYIAVKNGGQAAIMAPTEVLARQHMKFFESAFAPLGINAVVLVGSLNRREKSQALSDIEDGSVQIIIGTHALIQPRVAFYALSLVITDEQHRFGVAQRAALANKGLSPHSLVMSATPIPRTLGLILYADMDISIIDEIPPGRVPISSYAVTSAYRRRVFAFIEKEARNGGQAYVICPAIDNEETQSVIRYADMARKLMPGLTVARLHGKMNAIDKNDVMARFARGEISVLVSTTVIEVGVNAPNATVALIENAERFGLSQLHQLRGRVGRGQKKSYCVLITDSESETTKRRVKAFTDTTDGFAISELDLDLRGPGDFFGVKQHGLPEFKIVNLYRDISALKIAQEAAKDTLDRDPRLILEENAALAQAVERFLKRAETAAVL
ncbi:MAG: ATP-dependent DNA helicase RecG [Clostridiales bacterium]|jgi:ATP-dependent DNA helicase RecG|nr:ATP-dependent DNA helicase RecG [Clostridiales bacterium]